MKLINKLLLLSSIILHVGQAIAMLDTDEYYKEVVEKRISQGLKGKELVRNMPDDTIDLLKRLIYGGSSDLIKKIIDYEPAVLKNEKKMLSYFEIAIFVNNPALFEYFIKQGANVNTIGNSTALIRACSKPNRIDIITYLLMNRANPNLQDCYGMSALSECVSSPFHYNLSANTPYYARLITSGADHTIKTYGNLGWGSKHNIKTAMEIAQIEGHPELAEFIEKLALERENLLMGVITSEKIRFTAKDGNERETWISRRHVRDTQGNSLLYYALKSNNLPIAKKLLLLWPELLSQPNFEGQTIFDLATTQDYLNIAKAFLDIDCKPIKREITIFTAAQDGDLETLKKFIQNGQNILERNLNGFNAFQLAEKSNQLNILEFITKYQIEELKKEDDPTCFICEDAEPSYESPFTLCDYGCLKPICIDCKNDLPKNECPQCMRPLCKNIIIEEK